MIEGSRRTRLTTDGQINAAARAPSGDLLLGKREGGRNNIWWLGRDGTSRRLTNGDFDVTPQFSPDGQSWVYADYDRKSIVLCEVSGGTCRVLRNDQLLPSWPTFSPDGEKLAYVTQVGSTQVTIVSARDGHYLDSWNASSLCPPAWSSAATVWSLEISAGRYVWFERDIREKKKTGKRYETQLEGAPTDDFQCWPKTPSPNSPPSQSVRVETEVTSVLLGLP
jgi:dipeptidyl aminopeptidase/acylaminoacyl peptidase